jgi:hypothetical protein
MKTQFPYAFIKHLCTYSLSLMCTFFIFLSNFSSFAQTQCPNGVSVSMFSDLTSPNTAIPFGTPITVTTVVRNNTSTAQTVNLQTSLSPGFALPQFNVLCAGDYSWNGSIAQRSFTVQPGAANQISSTITLVYNLVIPNQSPAGNSVQSSALVNGSFCTTTLSIPSRNSDALPLGAPNTTTTVSSLQAGATGSLIIRGNVILDVNHIAQPVGNGAAVIYPYIYMDEGATLTIPNGRTLELRGARVFGIRTMWNSIVVQPGGTLITGLGNSIKTTIGDGIRAIEAMNGSNIDVIRTNFIDNSTSLYVAPTLGSLKNINFISPFINCNFEGTGQLRPLPTSTVNCTSNKFYGYPYTGFDINDVSSLVTVSGAFTNTPKPIFRNMSNGILTQNTRLFINRVLFQNIKYDYSSQGGLAVYCYGANSLILAAGDPTSNDLEFSNCDIGISYQQFGNAQLAQINNKWIM